MNVLFATYPHIGLNTGGIRSKIDRTAEALRGLGVTVEYYDPWRNQIPQADLLHCFSIDPSLLYHVRLAKAEGRAVVASPVVGVSGRAGAT